MIQLALAVLAYVPTFLRSRHDLGLEILACASSLPSSNDGNRDHRSEVKGILDNYVTRFRAGEFASSAMA